MKQCNRHLIGFNDIPVIMVGIPLVAFFMPLLFFGDTLENGLPAYLPKFTIALFHTSIYWFSLRALVLLLRRRFPEHKDTGRRMTWMLLTVTPVIILIDASCNLLMGGLEEIIGVRHGPPKIDYLVAACMISALVLSIYEGFYFYHRWRQSVLEAERLRRENMQSQLEGLKSQVNPHFLFNSLNTLTYLIPEDSDRAVRFVQQLSKVYRYILEIRDQPLITLREELNFLDAYLFLLHERFGDNLRVELDVDPAAYDLQLIPLSLQMLFENAIKHNIISREQPLCVILSTTEGQDALVVRNKLQLKRQNQRSTRVGLNNIRRRYAFYTSEDVLVDNSDGWFTVRLPLLRVSAEASQQVAPA